MEKVTTPKDLELVLAQVVTRHGFRTPITLLPHDRTKWECDKYVEYEKYFQAYTIGKCDSYLNLIIFTNSG